MEPRKMLTTKLEDLTLRFKLLQELAHEVVEELESIREQMILSWRENRENEAEEFNIFISLREDPLPGLRPAV